VTGPRSAGGSPLVQKVGWLVIGVVLGALLGFVLGRLGRPASPEPIAVAWQASDDEELDELLSAPLSQPRARTVRREARRARASELGRRSRARPQAANSPGGRTR
jgi:hypothetical protein